MRLITFSGPPSCGKTSVIVKMADAFRQLNQRVGVVKFDCLYTDDDRVYARNGIVARKGLSGPLCPDHYFVSNIEEVERWGKEQGFDYLITESAGLCNRCAPYIRDVLGICVIDNLSGINTPRKIGPMLRMADLVLITKGDIVSQAEREVFAARVATCNPRAPILHINGLTGQGAFELAGFIRDHAEELQSLAGKRLRYAMPQALCSYCLGETRIGEEYKLGNIRDLRLADQAQDGESITGITQNDHIQEAGTQEKGR